LWEIINGYLYSKVIDLQIIKNCITFAA